MEVLIHQWHTPAEMAAGWAVISQMYPKLSQAAYCEKLEAICQHRYTQFAAIFDGQVVGVVGLWLFPRVWCGLQADIDNFVVDKAYRSQGIGKQLLDHALEVAQGAGAEVAILDSFVENPQSHRFYFDQGFAIRGYHFAKPLVGQSLWG